MILKHTIVGHIGSFLLFTCNVGTLIMPFKVTAGSVMKFGGLLLTSTWAGADILIGLQILGVAIAAIGSTFFGINEFMKWQWRMEQRQISKENKAIAAAKAEEAFKKAEQALKVKQAIKQPRTSKHYGK